MEKDLNTLTELYLNDNAVKEFDATISKYRRKKIAIGSISCILSVTLVMTGFLFISDKGTEQSFSTAELIETINDLSFFDSDDISSITVTPKSRKAIIVIDFKDGSSKQFIMHRNEDGSSIELTAQKSK